MTLTAKGFAGGPLSDDDWGAIGSPLAWFGAAGQFDVVQPVGGTRSVSIAAGTAVQHGVRAVNDATITQALSAPGSGTQWYMLALRRDWSAKTVSLVVLPGPATTDTGALSAAPSTLPATFQNTPGTAQADQPLVWVQVRAAVTALVIFDLRMRRGALNYAACSIDALNTHGLVYPPLQGTTITDINTGITYRWDRKPVPGTQLNVAPFAWRPWDSQWIDTIPTFGGLAGNPYASPGYLPGGRYRFAGGKVRFEFGVLANSAMSVGAVTVSLPVTADLWGYQNTGTGGYLQQQVAHGRGWHSEPGRWHDWVMQFTDSTHLGFTETNGAFYQDGQGGTWNQSAELKGVVEYDPA